jgi:hypothetical protein
MLREAYDGDFDRAAKAVDPRAKRDSWSVPDQRRHLETLLGVDTLDQEAFVENSGSVCGILCCDSHLLWCWGHSKHHYQLIKNSGKTEHPDDADEAEARDPQMKYAPDKMTKFDLVKDWFGQMVASLGCNSPKEDNVVYLHGFTLRGNLFPMMKSHFESCGLQEKIPTKAYFCYIWNRVHEMINLQSSS